MGQREFDKDKTEWVAQKIAKHKYDIVQNRKRLYECYAGMFPSFDISDAQIRRDIAHQPCTKGDKEACEGIAV